MNYLDMERTVSWIETRWGPSKTWGNWEKLQPDFQNYTPGAVMEALHGLYQSGLKYPPSPSELQKAVGPVQARRIRSGEDDVELEDCVEHAWADPVPTDLERVRVCVRCGEESAAAKCGHEHRNRFGVCVYCLDGSAVPGGEE